MAPNEVVYRTEGNKDTPDDKHFHTSLEVLETSTD